VRKATRPAIFKWRQTAPEVIVCAVRWYLRYSLSLRDVEELLDERGLKADHTTVWRWVQRYGPELEQRLRRYLKPANKSWRVDETYVRVKGRWCYLYRAIDSTGATIEFLLSPLRDCPASTISLGCQTAVSQGSQRSITSTAPGHQHRSGTPLRRGDSRSEGGRNPPPPLSTSTGPIFEQYPVAGSSSNQTTSKAKQNFREFQAARRTIEGYEAIHRIRKGQARWISGKDIRKQNQFIDKLFELPA
jgi:transposase-like protein